MNFANSNTKSSNNCNNKRANEEMKKSNQTPLANQLQASKSDSVANASTNASTNADAKHKKKIMNANANQYLPQRRPHQWHNTNTNFNMNSNTTRSRQQINNNYNNKYNRSTSSSHQRTNSHHAFEPEKSIQDPLQHQQLVQKLKHTLHIHKAFEQQLGNRKRLQAYNHLLLLLRQWSNNDNQDNPSSSMPQIKLISFGSYRLGVHAPDADMDLLALCPPAVNVTKQDFFDTFVQTLRDDRKCTRIHPIAKAYTPVIKFYLDGIPIDLLFVKLIHEGNIHHWTTITKQHHHQQQQQHPTEFQIHDSMLRGLDEPSSRSLNGVRVAQYLWNTIPNHDKFKIVLKTIKVWAQVHGLYSNVLGFLGGVNWAILVAWVCKRHEDAEVTTLIKVFFYTFARWRWPKPVFLTPIVKNPPQGVTPLTIWDPARNPRDRAQILPIITPCYPSMNSSYNVAQPQMRRLREELHRADKIMNQIKDGNAQWTDLLKENDFFSDHVHYLQVRIIAENEEDHQAWFGLCESRLRILIAGLDSVNYGTHAYPFTKFFVRNRHENSGTKPIDAEEIVTYFFIALRFEAGAESVDLIGCTTEFSYSVNSWEGRKKGMDLKIDHVLQSDLPQFVFEGSLRKENKVEGEEKDLLRGDGEGDGNGDACLNRMANPNDCLASPTKKARIGRP